MFVGSHRLITVSRDSLEPRAGGRGGDPAVRAPVALSKLGTVRPILALSEAVNGPEVGLAGPGSSSR